MSPYDLLMRLVLIGDIHGYRLSVPPRELLGKRLIGQANLWLMRRMQFNTTLLDRVMTRALELLPDLAVWTGDLTSTALQPEFDDILERIEPFARRLPMLVVPGNHDRYTFASMRQHRFESSLNGMAPRTFPHLRELSAHWYLLALDSAVPNMVSSRGRIGHDQLEHTSALLDQTDGDKGLVVLCHYPVAVPKGQPMTWAHRLADFRKLTGVLAQHVRPTLFLHGHIHQPWSFHPDRGPLMHVTHINAGSPTMVKPSHPHGQGFWQIDLPDDPAATVGLVHHVPDDHTGQWVAQHVQ